MDQSTLPELDLSAKVEGLKLQLKARGLKVSGRKAELIDRLRQHVASQSRGQEDGRTQAEP
eukprot:11515792-Karenia_brevis.AAC.1